MHHGLRPLRDPHDNAPSVLDRLEPRVLLTAFAAQPLLDGLGIPAVLHDIEVDRLAAAVAPAGDIDADGHADFAVGLPGSHATDSTPAVPGEVRLYSGRTGELLRTLTDDFVGFGASLASPGDLTGDGVADLLVGSPLAHDPGTVPIEGGNGKVYLFSGADGAPVRTLLSAGNLTGVRADAFGFSLAVVGDLDSDGLPELLVGAPHAGQSDRGEAYLFSGADGALLRTFSGENPGDEFGYAVSRALVPATAPGGSGTSPGVAIGAPRHDPGGVEDAGSVYVFDAATGALDETFTQSNPGEHFGSAVALHGAAGGTRLAFGAPGATINGMEAAGRVYLQNGGFRSGAAAGARMGEFLSAVGDLTGLGASDLAIAAPGEGPAGRTHFVSAYAHGTNIIDGVHTVAAGDVNDDGAPDLITLQNRDDAPALARVISSAAVIQLGRAQDSSDNLAYIYFPLPAWLVSSGRIIRFAEDPLFDGLRFASVNNDGVVLAQEIAGGNEAFIIRDGQRIRLRDTVSQIVGADTLGSEPFTAIKINNDGAALLRQGPPTADIAPKTWLYEDGVFTFLWTGRATDLSNTGEVIGAEFPAGAVPFTRRRAADGAISQIAGFAGEAIADDGVIAGTDAGGALAIWQNGAITPLAPRPSGLTATWSVTDIAAGRRVLAQTIEFFSPTAPGIVTLFLDEPGPGLRTLDQLTVDEIPSPIPPRALVLSPDGRILLNTAILVPFADIELFRPAPGSTIAPVLRASGAVTAIARNQFNDLVAFNAAAGSWTGLALSASSDDHTLFRLRDADLFSAFADPISGRTIIVRTGADGTVLLNADTAAREQFLGILPESTITANLVVFASTDGRIHIAGTNAAGDWISFFQTGAINPASPAANPAWASSNLSEHLAAQGLTLPALTGTSVLVTPWNAFHIVGLDDSGEIQSLWWSPAIDSGLWTTTNLSAAARPSGTDTPALTGNLATFVTPWNTIHIAGTTAPAGTDAGGQLSILWWAPGPDNSWRADTISSPDGAPSLAPGSLATTVTPWGGLSIFGVATSGKADISDPNPDDLVAYWWTPTTPSTTNPSGWRLTSIHDAGPTPRPLVITGPISPLVTPAGHQHLFAAATLSNSPVFIDFSWTPDQGNLWLVAALTNIVA